MGMKYWIRIEMDEEDVEGGGVNVRWNWEGTSGMTLALIEEMIAMYILGQSDLTSIPEMEIMEEVFGYMQDFREAPEKERPIFSTGERLRGAPKDNYFKRLFGKSKEKSN